jgi:hypothetical protein
MALTNYNDLVSTVESYLARSDLTAVIPTFIQFAQERMSRNFRTSAMLTTASLTVTGGSTALPSDFLEMRDIYFDTNPATPLRYQTPDQFYRNLLTQTSGLPLFYTIIDGQFKFAPTPNLSATANILYYAKPAYISPTVSTNIYLTNYADALLYATLGEAEPYLMNDSRIQTWASLYERAVADIMNSDLGTKYPNAALNVTAY